MNNIILQKLVDSGVLKSFSIRTLDNYENKEVIFSDENSAQTEEATLVFSTGEVLIIKPHCQGMDENANLIFSLC